MKKSVETGSADRLFHTLIVLGAALATACGGTIEDGAGGSTGDGSLGVGGTAASGGSVGAGGAVILATGGSGGSPDETPVPPESYDCLPSQWNCANAQIHCDYDYDDNGYQLMDPEACTCDPSRPATAGDCDETEDFVCRSWTKRADGHPFTESISLECSCRPRSDYCEEYCGADGYGSPIYSSCDPAAVSPRSILCGCAAVILK